MSDVVLLAPHADDEALFAAYLCLRHRPHVVVCLDDGDPVRTRESELAAQELGCRITHWHFRAARPDWSALRRALENLGLTERLVFAPAVEEGGHRDHNTLGEIALEVFGPERVTSYLTYAPRGQRSRDGREVVPEEPAWIARKLAAMACYRSQIANEQTRLWFYPYPDLREWIAA